MHEVPLFCMLRTDALQMLPVLLCLVCGSQLGLLMFLLRVLHLAPEEQDTIGKFVMLAQDTPRKTSLKTWRLLVYFKHTMRREEVTIVHKLLVIMQDMVQYTAQLEEKKWRVRSRSITSHKNAFYHLSTDAHCPHVCKSC